MAVKTTRSKVPDSLPLYYPDTLKTKTRLILAVAVRMFPTQADTLELCRRIVSELTPAFSMAVRSKTIKSSDAEYHMSELLRCVLIYNCDYEHERLRLQEEVRRSDQWLRFSEEMARPATDEAAPKGKQTRRLTSSICSPAAAKRMEEHIRSHGIGLTEFASQASTTDRTLRKFRKTGKIRRDIFESIAKVMGTTKEALLKVE